ncbi:MAG TPA: hypothetical protein PLP34_11270 [Chitinophagaceae bacterium]|nr:hypothetical protein [Chitinophagaceae bacterium]HNF72991.1 hypothetical protein [Chitinophagaceae bacterium]
MKTNPEQWPEELFDWAEHIPFEFLTDVQQQTVLVYMSAEEYMQMYEAQQVMQEWLPAAEKEELPSPSIPVAPLKQFRNTSILTGGFWKAAAVLLLCTTVYFALRSGKKEMHSRTIVKHDTLFIEKKVALKDSGVWVRKSETKKIPSVPNRTFHPRRQRDMVVQEPPIALPVLPVKRFNETENTIRGNHRNSDSFERSFRFVSL